MSLNEFLGFDEMEQIEAFWTGVFIGRRSDGGFVIECRQIDDFYVEYKILGGHYIDIHVFKDPAFLQAYLSEIDISTVMDFMNKH